jgi:hypothetical protein
LFSALKAKTSGLDASDALAGTDCFKCGCDAFQKGYYWEAHELWESIWMALPPQSAERQLLRGLIQLANAGLKGRMGRQVASQKILSLADAAISESRIRGGDSLMGLKRGEIVEMRRQVSEQQQ